MPIAVGVYADSYNAPSGAELPVTSGLVGWWDAADAATISHSSGDVSAWADKSGLGRHLAFGGVGWSQVVTGTRTINGKNVVDFPDHSQMLTATFNVPQPVTVFAATASDTASAGNRQIVANRGSATIWAYNNMWSLYAGGVLQSGTTLDTSPHVASAVFNGASSELWLDGVSILVGNPGTSGFPSGVYVGSDGSGNWDGPVAEVIVYDRVLSGTERGQVEAYLSTKWGTPAPPVVGSGLVGWWDASDASSITASAGAVSQWNDKSGNGRHVTQATADLQPLTGSRTLNGRNTLEFWATTPDALVSGSVVLTPPVTWIMVVKSDIAPGSNNWVTAGSGAAVQVVYYTSQWQLYSAGVELSSGISVDTNSHVIVSLFSPTIGQMWVDGVAGPVGNSGAAATSAILIGGNTGSAALDGLLGELLIYDRALTTTERQQVESYLKAKWGTP